MVQNCIVLPADQRRSCKKNATPRSSERQSMPPIDPSKNSPGVSAPRTLDPRFHLAAIVDSSDDPIISKDLDGIIRSWNGAATRVFGYRPEEMVGQSIYRLIPPDLYYEEEEILRKLRAGERIDHHETVRLRKSGEKVAVSVTISPVRDE